MLSQQFSETTISINVVWDFSFEQMAGDTILVIDYNPISIPKPMHLQVMATPSSASADIVTPPSDAQTE
jgi:hypothetical protein